jgi:hypothetical protein
MIGYPFLSCRALTAGAAAGCGELLCAIRYAVIHLHV